MRVACLDAASGNLLSRLSWGGTESRTKVTTNAIGKIERALNAAINTYYRLKHGNRQTIRIEKVVIESGAQAVVGNVAHHGGGAAAKPEDQPHALGHATSAAMPSQIEAEREAVPVTGGHR